MKEILTYLLGVTVCSGVFAAFYRLALHRFASFRTSRAFLPASLVCAALIPAFDIPVWHTAPVELSATAATQPFATIETATASTIVAPTAEWIRILPAALYAAGVAVLVTVMVRQTIRIARIRRRSERYRAGGCEVAVSEEVSAPFSFLATIYAPKGTPPGEMRQIVAHEASHIRHRHSVEKIIMELLKTLMWFNPFAWWASRLLVEVHEFEADRDVLDGGFTVEEYLPVIFRQIFGYIPEISAGLGNSLTKKRFEMMKNKMKQTRYGWLRTAGVLPLAAGMLALFGFTHRAPEIIAGGGPAQIHSGESALEQTPDEPVFIAEHMPRFRGTGDLNDFRRWVNEQMVYPPEAKEANIGGRVTAKFIVEKDGSVSGIEIISSPHRLLSDEVVRILKSSPAWTPGKQTDKPIRVSFILPVDFRPDSGRAEPAANGKSKTVVMRFDNKNRTGAESGEEKITGVIGEDGAIYIMDADGENSMKIDVATVGGIPGEERYDVHIEKSNLGEKGEQKTFIWFEREKKEASSLEGEITTTSVELFSKDSLDELPDEVKTAIGGRDYNSVMVIRTEPQ